VKQALCTLEYTAVVGAIFNDFFLNPTKTVMITRSNIQVYEQQLKKLLSIFDRWYNETTTSSRKYSSRLPRSAFYAQVFLGFLNTVGWFVPGPQVGDCDGIAF
jgi:hypothetical protein